jgi:hypothetical protein
MHYKLAIGVRGSNNRLQACGIETLWPTKALSGDHDGVANWNMNASRFDQLRRGWHVKPDTLL